ncbi:uncharacterized [Tachysurus ichikawai]
MLICLIPHRRPRRFLKSVPKPEEGKQHVLKSFKAPNSNAACSTTRRSSSAPRDFKLKSAAVSRERPPLRLRGREINS